MKSVIYEKGIKGGTVLLPPSKSVAHRALLCAALSGGACTVSPIDDSADMRATLGFIRCLGRGLTVDSLSKTVSLSAGIGGKTITVDCGESGSTLRFIIPICAALGLNATFTGHGRLPQRPIGLYTQLLRGVTATGEGLPYTIKGKLQSGDFALTGNVSSQFITGLLFALPLLAGDSRIVLTTPLESKSYVNLTIEVLARFGIAVLQTEYGYFVRGGQCYKPQNYTVEGDWSHAAFYLSMAAFCKNSIKVLGLRADSTQGDKACATIFASMGIGVVAVENGLLLTQPKDGLRAICVDVTNIPDMVPALAATMALAKGQSQITGAARLRIKESDRLSAMANALNTLGARVLEQPDGLVITGVPALRAGHVQGCNDHRIVMSMAALAGEDLPIAVTDAQSIQKSYPDFYKDYVNLGGMLRVVNMGE